MSHPCGAESDRSHSSVPAHLTPHLCRSSSRQFTMAFLCSMMVTSSCISTFSLTRSSSVQSFSTQTNPKEEQAIKWLKELGIEIPYHDLLLPQLAVGPAEAMMLWRESPVRGISGSSMGIRKAYTCTRVGQAMRQDNSSSALIS